LIDEQLMTMMLLPMKSLLLLSVLHSSECLRRRTATTNVLDKNATQYGYGNTKRGVQSSTEQVYYWETNSLGFFNLVPTTSNPLKGLSGNPQAGHPSTWPESIPSSLHHYKIGLDLVMLGDPDVVGVQSAFNWTYVDEALRIAETFRAHTILRFYIHYPGAPLNIPAYLMGDITTLWNTWNNEVAPWYGDFNLRKAFRQFIDHLSRRYDGDTRIYAIQAGLIGYWGE
jgi:hypothetical protein